jgi:hypothetical protein
VAYPDPKIVTVAAPTNPVNTTRPPACRSARSTTPTRLYVVILSGGQHLNPAERMAAFQHVDQIRATEDADTIFSGQLTLSMLLLSKLAEARGATEENLMDEVGNILQEISRGLQE